MVIVLVLAEVIRELGDSLGKERDLHFSRPDVSRMGLKFLDDLRFSLLCYGHSFLQRHTGLTALRDWRLRIKHVPYPQAPTTGHHINHP